MTGGQKPSFFLPKFTMKTKPTITGKTIDVVQSSARLEPDVLQQRHKLNNVTTTVKSKEKNTKNQKTDYAERATERVIKLIEEGNPVWRRTWGSYGLAKNFVTGNHYKGVNFLF